MRQGVRVTLAVFVVVVVTAVTPAAALEQDWMHQFGTASPDDAEDVAVTDDGAVYVVGQTSGALPGQLSAGTVDAFVRKYDASGRELWTRQFGSYERDFAKGVAVDGTGAVYVAGQTFGTLPGQASAGSFDAFVRKYDSAGRELWTRQFGTRGGEGAVSVATDGAGAVYVAGSTRAVLPRQTPSGEYDAFLRKYGRDGTEIWTHQFGTPEDDFATDVAVHASGAAVVVGQTTGVFTGQTHAGALDSFIRGYAPDGLGTWTHQFGSSADDRALSVAVDGAGVAYVAGSTNGALPGQISAGESDAFLHTYDRLGRPAWARQFGTRRSDDAASVAVDRSGAIYVVGRTFGAFPGQVSAGDFDAYVRWQAPSGVEMGTHQFGTAKGDYALAVALDGAGTAHAVGGTLGVLADQSGSGGRDAFAVRFSSPAHGPRRTGPL